jgi:hypothetical protein
VGFESTDIEAGMRGMPGTFRPDSVMAFRRICLPHLGGQNYDIDATVLRASPGGEIAGYRVIFSVSSGGESFRREAVPRD